ncbi:MAG: VOC family protein [Deltaproteobacteria bacterium]|nr:VOC family protein [Deltaproteobacteria bacterium]
MTRVHHVALFVSDMDRSLYLFQDILGLMAVWHVPEIKGNRMSALLGIPDIRMEIAYLRNGSEGAAVELCRVIHPVAEKGPQPFGSPGTLSLSLRVKDLDRLHDRLTQEGWPPFSPCLEMSDPEGHPVRLFCFPVEEGTVVELFEKSSRKP